MKSQRASDSARLIARGLLLADVTPRLRPLLAGESVAVPRQLLNDPWFDFLQRQRLVRALLHAVERLLLPGILLHWLARKRLIEKHAREALDAGCEQLVVLGAGRDTLAWRLRELVPCFELDHPATQSLMRELMADDLTLVPVDLVQGSVAEALTDQAGFASGRATLFIAEGLLMYLPERRVAALLRELATVGGHGSRCVFSFMETHPGSAVGFFESSPVIKWWLRWRGEPFQWGLFRQDAGSFLSDLGWRLLELSSPEELRRRFLAPHRLEQEPLAVGESVALAQLAKS